jgi:hypothetical protein
MLHFKDAERLLCDDSRAYAAQAGQQFLQAANALEYLSSVLLPRWRDSSGLRPPAVRSSVCLFLAVYFEARAQCCAVVKALAKAEADIATPSYPILTKLACGIVDKCRYALDVLHGDADAAAKIGNVSSALLEQVCNVRETFSALAYYFQGEVYRSTENTGFAIAYLRRAKVRIV